jgi:hypothetical protein
VFAISQSLAIHLAYRFHSLDMLSHVYILEENKGSEYQPQKSYPSFLGSHNVTNLPFSAVSQSIAITAPVHP